ncbi:2-amino-3-carboxymuconate-6-semialdehyde decarboxylase protein [Mycena chlorophos]|uniref:2-amino-3-carboxymuconate-6-semialdehyde decarboxylase protein n=1 Tax=Mycena chlorophos TaxID=658473 RepID=A0A8H6W1Y2_MYCCL|nr:2-amino-3-carboxymuconate-6-semialdehyde decarboxylase protein [Mycena chlorophos]
MHHPLITLEEHFQSQTLRPQLDDADELNKFMAATFGGPLESLGSDRLAAMDAGRVAVQVLSHVTTSGGIPSAAVAQEINNEASEAVRGSEGRYAGFATLAMGEPATAAAELRRCVEQLGFVGALIDNDYNGSFYDDERFWPVFAVAEELNVPIYLHPSPPGGEARLGFYHGNYPQGIAVLLSQFGWGWHSDCALHFLRLYSAGLFDKHPGLKLVLGHMGEMLPFQLARLQSFPPKFWGGWRRSFSEVWRENVWVTTSGMFSLVPMRCLLEVKSADKVMVSVDYPFAKPKQALEFMEALEKSGMVSAEELEGIAYKNAEKLLRIKAPQL